MQNHKSIILSKAITLLKKYQNEKPNSLVSVEEIKSYTRALHEGVYYSGNLLRIALIGEFKSGKSTLLNAILGGYYSATDLLEMTGWIARYIPSDEEYCQIEYNSGAKEEINLSDFLLKTTKRQYGLAELSNIKLIEIGYKNEASNLIYIDCPGYGTSNLQNESLMMQTLNESDLLLLCIDVTILGGEKETSLINLLLTTKTPYLCICTKSDNLTSVTEKDEVIAYLVDKLGISKDKIFFTAALLNDKTNGIEEVKHHLASRISNLRIEIKQAAEFSFYSRIFLSLIDKIRTIKKEVLVQLANIDNFKQNLALIEKNVSTETLAGCKEICNTRFIKEIKSNILHDMLSAAKDMKQTLNDNIINTILKKHISDEYLKKIIEEINVFIKASTTAKWIERYEELVKINMSKPEKEHLPMISADSSQFNWNFGDPHDTTLESGFITSVGLGAALSAYAAWLGPMAPFVSIGSAMTFVGFPIALMGGGVAFALSKYKQKKKEESLAVQYDLFLEEYKNTFFESVLKEQILITIKYINSQFSTFILNNYANENFAYLPSEPMEVQLKELTEIDNLISANTPNLIS